MLRHHLAGRGCVSRCRWPFTARLGPSEVRHVDHGRAVWSGGSAVACDPGVLRVLDWHGLGGRCGGGGARGAVACCFFAALDDPVPAIVSFLTWSVVAGGEIDGVLLFGVLPAAHDFPDAWRWPWRRPSWCSRTLTAMPATSHDRHGADRQRRHPAEPAEHLRRDLCAVREFRPGAGRGHGDPPPLSPAVVRSAGAEWSAWRLLRRGWGRPRHGPPSGAGLGRSRAVRRADAWTASGWWRHGWRRCRRAASCRPWICWGNCGWDSTSCRCAARAAHLPDAGAGDRSMSMLDSNWRCTTGPARGSAMH